MLKQEEFQKLVRIVSGLDDFVDPIARKGLIQGARLNRLIGSLNLSGAPGTVAVRLIDRLNEYGPLPDRQNYHALGALLTYLLSSGALNQAEEQFFAEIIVRYSLVDDLSYLNGLREQYKISGPAVRSHNPAAPLLPHWEAGAIPPPAPPAPQNLDELEAIINSRDNFLDIPFLLGAVYCAQAVCCIEIPEATAIGTGFLIGPDLLLTNYHVLSNQALLKRAVARFGYWEDRTGVASFGQIVEFDPDFYYGSPVEQLDYALVRLRKQPLADRQVDAAQQSLPIADLVLKDKHRGYLLPARINAGKDDRINIIQHPGGRPMKAVLTQNYVVETTATYLHYLADTEGGSSGSPVFNRLWQVVAIHHSGVTTPGGSTQSGQQEHFRYNEGIHIHAILQDLAAKGLSALLPT